MQPLVSTAKAIVHWIRDRFIALGQWLTRGGQCGTTPLRLQLARLVDRLRGRAPSLPEDERTSNARQLAASFTEDMPLLDRLAARFLARELTAEEIEKAMDESMGRIKQLIERETRSATAPHVALLSVQIQGEKGEPFLGSMCLSRAPSSTPAVDTLQEQMRTYVGSNKLKQLTISGCIVSHGRPGFYDLKMIHDCIFERKTAVGVWDRLVGLSPADVQEIIKKKSGVLPEDLEEFVRTFGGSRPQIEELSDDVEGQRNAKQSISSA